MTSRQHNEINKYIRKVEKQLICKKNLKKSFIKAFRNDVYLFIENNPKTDIKEIIEYFGRPNEISLSFYSDEEINTLKKISKKYFKIKIITIIAVIILVLIIISIQLVIKYLYNGGSTTVGTILV